MTHRWRARVGVALVGVVALSAGALVVAAPPAWGGPPPNCGSASNPLPADPTGANDGGANSLRAAVTGDCAVIVLTAGGTFGLHTNDELAIGPSGSFPSGITIESSSTGQNATIQQLGPSQGNRVIDVENGVSATFTNLNITGGTRTAATGGGGIRSEDNSHVTLTGDSIIGNSTSGIGGGINSHSSQLTIMNTTFSGNCATAGGGAIFLNDSSTGSSTNLLQNSTVSGNTTGEQVGAIDVAGTDAALTMYYVTLVSNTVDTGLPSCGLSVGSTATNPNDPPEPESTPTNVTPQSAVPVANLFANGDGASVTSFGTVIADPLSSSSANNCLIGTAPTTKGYNYESGGNDMGTSCRLTGGPGDVQNGVTPVTALVGALGANGGPTNTQVPPTGSPLIDAIPDPGGGCPASPTVITTDQRGISRPQGAGCEIGAVEVVVPVTVTAAFTG
jgi:hypothetical protein